MASDLWPIQANPTQIHRIRLNLAVNARDAMLPRGGPLRLRAHNRLLTEHDPTVVEGAKPGAYVVLEVGDTGTGMPPEVLARIWAPFFTSKGEGQGTGVELSTVRGIAAAHRGSVTVDPRVGNRTTLRVFLPADESADSHYVDGAASSLLRGHGELIMVVDDEANVHAVAAAILTHHGYRVIACGDGVDAIGLCSERDGEIHVVVSDLNRPRLDGATLALVLRRLQPDPKIVAITGLGERDSAATPELAVFTGTIQKPFTVEALLMVLYRILHCDAKAGATAMGRSPSSPWVRWPPLVPSFNFRVSFAKRCADAGDEEEHTGALSRTAVALPSSPFLNNRFCSAEFGAPFVFAETLPPSRSRIGFSSPSLP